MRLPRAEDRALVYVAIDGQMLEIEGEVQHVRLHAAGGINTLTGRMLQDHVRTRGEITITFSTMQRAVIEEGESAPPPALTIVLPPPERTPDALPPGT